MVLKLGEFFLVMYEESLQYYYPYIWLSNLSQSCNQSILSKSLTAFVSSTQSKRAIPLLTAPRISVYFTLTFIGYCSLLLFDFLGSLKEIIFNISKGIFTEETQSK